jgi:hypothetical protein
MPRAAVCVGATKLENSVVACQRRYLVHEAQNPTRRVAEESFGDSKREGHY